MSVDKKPVYITYYNLGKITSSISMNMKIDQEGIWTELKELLKESGLTLEDAKEYFSFKEHKEMYLDSLALENFTKFSEIVEDVDTSKIMAQISASSSPAYHYNKECQAMLSDYHSIKAPLGVKVSEKELMLFAKQNQHMGEEQLNIKLKQKYNTNLDFSFIDRANSGAVDLNASDTLNHLVTEIKNHIENMSKMLHNKDNQFMANVISRLRYADMSTIYRAFKGKKDSSEYNIGREFALHKLHIRKLLIQYYKIKSAHDTNNDFIEFDEVLLRDFGFKACKKCIQNLSNQGK